MSGRELGYDALILIGVVAVVTGILLTYGWPALLAMVGGLMIFAGFAGVMRIRDSRE